MFSNILIPLFYIYLPMMYNNKFTYDNKNLLNEQTNQMNAQIWRVPYSSTRLLWLGKLSYSVCSSTSFLRARVSLWRLAQVWQASGAGITQSNQSRVLSSMRSSPCYLTAGRTLPKSLRDFSFYKTTSSYLSPLPPRCMTESTRERAHTGLPKSGLGTTYSYVYLNLSKTT